MGSETPGSATDSVEPTAVDPRAPRFGQAITATLLAVGVALQRPELVYVVALILGVAVASQWRIDLYATLWQLLRGSIVGSPAATEAAAPHRFAKLVGALVTLVASGLFVAGFATAGYVVAGIVMVLAGVAAVFDLCVGCRMYRHVSYAQRIGWV